MSAVRDWMLAPPAKAAPKPKPRVYPDGTRICGVDMSGAPVMPDWLDNPRDWPEWVRRREDLAICEENYEQRFPYGRRPLLPDGEDPERNAVSWW